jgi:hypothetical protein
MNTRYVQLVNGSIVLRKNAMKKIPWRKKTMELMAIEIQTLIIHVLIIALATLGNVQWLKNWVCPERKRVYSLLSLFLLSVSVTMQMPFIPIWITTFYNLLTLGNAVIQFGYDALIRGIPNLIDKAMSNGAQKK